MPYDLYRAIEHAHSVISWQENLSKDEMPPEWMWTVDHELVLWFERIDEEREERYGTNRDTRESTPMMQNELAADWKQRHGR